MAETSKRIRKDRPILRNSVWQGSHQTLSMVSSAVIGVLLVLAVPVEEYGIYSYAMALVSIGMSVMNAGLGALAVKALLDDKKRNASILSALLLIREFFGLAGYAIILFVAHWSGNSLNLVAVILAGMAMLSRALDVPEIWYMANMQSQKPAAVRLVNTFSFLILRLAALIFVPSIWAFLGLFVLEALVATVAIFILYGMDSDSVGFRKPNFAVTLDLLRKSWPLLLSGVANQINLRGDIIVIQAMLGSTAVGVYAAASRLSEVVYFLPVVIMNATFPVLLNLRKEKGAKHSEYLSFLQRSYDRAFWSGVGVACIIGCIGWVVISWIFGSEYDESRYILLVQLIACPFIFMGAVYSKWIVSEGVLWSSLVRHSLGAATNILLNVQLIPILGLIGSAIATVSSYIVASYIACFVGRRSRPAGIQMTLAICLPVRLLSRLVSRRRIMSAQDKGNVK